MQAGFELFDHTADMGVRVWAPTMSGLVESAAAGLYSIIGELATTGATHPFNFTRDGRDAALLLRDLLTELLILFERDHRVVAFNDVEFDSAHVAVSGTSALVDEKRSVYFREVKAITYHELRLGPTDDHFEAVYIVDI